MVHIITDTTSCLSAEIAQKYKIPVIPQVINFGEESFYEGIDISNEEFIQRLKSSPVLPKTAAPPPELFRREFERLRPDEQPVLCIHPSAEVSGTVRSAIIAAGDFPEMDIRVIDTRSVASPLGTMTTHAAQWAAEGLQVDEIEARVKEMALRCRIYFLVDTLEFLARGGRIGGASALLGSMLQIKPILRMHEGRVDQYERERTHKRAVARIKEIVLEQVPTDGTGDLTIMEAGALPEAQALAKEMSILVNQDEIQIYKMPPAIITHGGPGILAAGFFCKKCE